MNDNLQPRKYFTVDEIAAYIGISRAMVYKLVERRQIPFIPYGRLRRFDREAIDDWIKKRSVEAKI